MKNEQFSDLVKNFYSFRKKEISKFLNPEEGLMTFPYSEREVVKKEQIASALIFWKFLKENFVSKDLIKRRFISFFLEHEMISEVNKYVRVVAMCESLPTSVWRKLLWRENIDFMSFESFLRRLSDEQIKEIENNYNDLFGSKKIAVIPRVFKKSLRDKIKILFGLINVKKLLCEKFNSEVRNQSKGAYAFSLLSLDFGFSLYPKGDDNDTKITNQKFTRFLSVKEHINDFIVNQEDGKYWWLYRKARSNYAFNPNKKIELGSHICPGFWKTLLLHFWFWIVSPIALATTGVIILGSGFSLPALIPAAFALPMIIWGLVAFIRFTLTPFFKWAKKSKIVKIPLSIIGYFLLGVLAVVIVYCIGWGCVRVIVSLSPIIGQIMSILLLLTVLFYLFYAIFCKFEYKDIPAFVRFILHFTLVATAVILINKYVIKYVIDFIVSTAKGFWEWYTNDLLISNWLILAILFLVVFFIFSNFYFKNEKIFARFEKLLAWISSGFLVLTILVIGVFFFRFGVFDFSYLGIIPLLFIVLTFIFVGFSMFMLDKVNSKTIEERAKILDFVTEMNFKISSRTVQGYINKLVNSKWLSPLGEDKWKKLDEINGISYSLFYSDSDYEFSFINLLIKKGDEKKLEIIILNKRRLRNDIETDVERFRALKKIINGMSADDAIKFSIDQEKFEEKAKERAEHFSESLATPFVATWKGIVWLATKIKQFFLTLKDIWVLFNKLCPFVTKPKELDF